MAAAGRLARGMTTNTATGRPRNGSRRDFVLPVRLRRATVKKNGEGRYCFRTSLGNLAIFDAIRRVSSGVNSFGVTEFWENSILRFAYLNMLA
jgi:hypothetical protein